MTSPSSLIPIESVGNRILLIRGQKVLLDRDLADLYGVETFNLNKAVKRNMERFPKDFVFQLTKKEWESLIFHFGISKQRGGSRYCPYAFTEQGIAMLSSVLHSPRAIQVNIAIMRTFVQLRHWLASHADLARKLEELEREYDENFRTIFEVIHKLMAPDIPQKGTIGFKLD